MLDLGMPKSLTLSDASADYLKAIWILGREGSVSTGDLAAHLGVTAPSVTGMLGKLRSLNLVTYERYRGAQLTEAGRVQALRLLRRHRLIETFLIDYLGYSWDEVHEEAEAMEHAMSDRFTERLAEKLGQPAFDPHGDPIPRPDGTLPERPSRVLTEFGVGERLEVSRITSQESQVLSYLVGLGIKPGVRLEVLSLEPFGKLYNLGLENREVAVSGELAGQIEGVSTMMTQELV